MRQWYMLTIVGEDRPGIVAKVTKSLFQGDANLGEASMTYLAGSFTIMMMVQIAASKEVLETLLATVIKQLELKVHIDQVSYKPDDSPSDAKKPDVQISVYGADRTGIVAQVTEKLAASGFNILDLNSNVSRSQKNPLYIMQIEGCAAHGIENLQNELASLTNDNDIDIKITPIELLVG